MATLIARNMSITVRYVELSAVQPLYVVI